MARPQVAESLDEVEVILGNTDMEGINPNIITHQLSILLDTKPIQQEKRTFAPEWLPRKSANC